MEIVDSGIPQEKVVIGKPGTPALVGAPDDGDDNGGTQVASGGGTQEASNGGTQEANSGDTQEAGGFQLDASTGTTEEASSEASSGTKMASGTKEATGSRRRANVNPHQNGFLETNTLAQCLVSAKSKGWNAGVMVWEFPDANTQWISNVRSLTWPVKA